VAFPTSANGASSAHLVWDLGVRPLASVSAVLTVVEPPAVDELYFWALQVGFGPGAGAHVGLQWLPPGRRRAANWGGYDDRGRELAGSAGGNTQPFPWEVGVPYRLSVARSPAGSGWRATVGGGEASWWRDLWVPAGSLSSPMVWSEVFADCEDPTVRVRWSGFSAVTVEGEVVRPARVRVSYQSEAEGGCGNGDVVADGDGFVQATSVPRRTPAGAWLEIQV
jgi:hypothetical protein